MARIDVLRWLMRGFAVALCGALTLGAATHPAGAQPASGGVSKSEIRIGHTVPYSGPVSAYGAMGKAQAAYYRMINEQGGVNGRAIRLLSRDDGYSPPKAVEQVRQLVEGEDVLAIVGQLGTPQALAVRKYLNGRRVPQLLTLSGSSAFNDPKGFPWSMGFQPTFGTEGHIFARYILEKRPGARIAILHVNDDLGKDYVQAIREGLGDKAATMIVGTQSYESTDPTVDSQIVALKATGADVMISVATPKFAAQSIRKVADLGWTPLHLVIYGAASVTAVMRPAGPQNATGVLSTAFYKDPTNPQFVDDEEVKAWSRFMDQYYPDGNKGDIFAVVGSMVAQTFVEILKRCGDDLTRDNVMKQAAALDTRIPMLLPGLALRTSATDYRPIKELRMIRFDGTSFVMLDDAVR
jgi:ABC-type branched-subunit amino acid transport system substrate-binding protein